MTTNLCEAHAAVRRGRNERSARDLRHRGQAGCVEKTGVSATHLATAQVAPDHPGATCGSRHRELVAAHKKIDAIRLYREISGLGLKESKDAVDKM